MQDQDVEAHARWLVKAFVEARQVAEQAALRKHRDAQHFLANILGATRRAWVLGETLTDLVYRVPHTGWIPSTDSDEHQVHLECLIQAQRAIMDAAPSVQVACVHLLLGRLLAGLDNLSGRNVTNGQERLVNGEPESELLVLLLRECHFIDGPNLCRLLRAMAANKNTWRSWGMMPVGPVLRLVTDHIRTYGMSAELTRELRDLRASAAQATPRSEVLGTIDGLFGIPLDPADAWGTAAREWFLGLSKAERTAWRDLLEHAKTATTTRPTAAWLATARIRIVGAGKQAARETLIMLLGLLVELPRRTPVIIQHSRPPFTELTRRNTTLVRGLVWYCSLFDDVETADMLARVCMPSFANLPGRSVKTGNACIWSLGAMAGTEGVFHLQQLARRLRNRSARRLIDKAIAAAAARAGLNRAELDELVVPDHGLVDGRMRVELGGYNAEIAVKGVHQVEMRWFRADGTPRKAVPVSVRHEWRDEIRALKRTADDIATTLLVHRDRIDGLMLAERTWTIGAWRERYLDHPLLSAVARRLIWWFGEGEGARAGGWLDGTIVDVEDRPLARLGDEARVRLWHPIDVTASEVLAWRVWLEGHAITQPFKQAHREVYLLTEAERATRVYSNRFAAHIIRQHQFNSLCATRDWRNRLRLMVDDEYPPASKELPSYGLRAEFWVEGAGDQYGVDTTEAGTFRLLTTDQVRFYPIGDPQVTAHARGGGYRIGRRPGVGEGAPLPLEEIPPLVFSEIMRDVDLFVGVASVGNDLDWQDGGPNGRYHDYWQDFAFGDLSASAQTRRAVFERLLPRLKIADRCSLADRFLVVRGELRTYKIHLGSSNVLMEPNDQYLCIVPDRRKDAGGAGSVLLPFEGDSVLSLILSKAFLLAEDRAIRDPSITRQIETG